MHTSKHMQAKTVGTKNGPGPNFALRNKKKVLPTKRKIDWMTDGVTSRYFPARMSSADAAGLMLSLVRFARNKPRQAHLRGHRMAEI